MRKLSAALLLIGLLGACRRHGTSGAGSTDGGSASSDGSSSAEDGGDDGGLVALCGAWSEACCDGGCSAGLECAPDGVCVQFRAGETGDPCNRSSECDAGHCVAIDGGRAVCVETCATPSDCVPGWNCPSPAATPNLCECAVSTERCDGLDNDCDGVVDDEPAADSDCEERHGAGQVCRNGVCTCAAECDGKCVNLDTDPDHCGSCGIHCEANGRDICSGGVCRPDNEWALWPIPADIPSIFEYDFNVDPAIVVDKLTGLTWERHIRLDDLRWDASERRCQTANFGGLTGWRLPTSIELASLLNFQYVSPPLLPLYFQTSHGDTGWAGDAWTGSAYATIGTFQPWSVYLGMGNLTTLDVSTTNALCVRSSDGRSRPLSGGGDTAPRGRYVVANGTVRDTVTGLTWQQTVDGTKRIWSKTSDAGSAQAYCRDLNLGGFTSGWRLPTQKELISTIRSAVEGPSIDRTAFPGTPTGEFWTSMTSGNGGSGDIWVVRTFNRTKLIAGSTDILLETVPAYTRCVR